MDFLELLQNADPETLQRLMNSSMVPDAMSAVGSEPMAQGRQVGNTYVASSPLEHLANAFRGYAKGRMLQNVGHGKLDLLRMMKGQVGPMAGEQVGMTPQMVEGDLPQE